MLQARGSLLVPNNIINDVNEKINPKNGILKGRVEMTAESEPRSFSDMIRETARSKNKHIEEDIFERHLRLKNQSASEKYRGYKNPVTGEDKIYTREDINHMSEAEYHRHKKAITAQKLRIGIPTNTEMEKAGTHGGVVHVNAYTRGDGTHVRSYWRSAPN